jgi:hypothetical protein
LRPNRGSGYYVVFGKIFWKNFWSLLLIFHLLIWICYQTFIRFIWLKDVFFLAWPIPLFRMSTHKQSLLSQLWTTALLCLSKNLILWRNSNPGLLFLGRMRRPLRQSAMSSHKQVKNSARTYLVEIWHVCNA